MPQTANTAIFVNVARETSEHTNIRGAFFWFPLTQGRRNEPVGAKKSLPLTCENQIFFSHARRMPMSPMSAQPKEFGLQ